MGTTPLSIGSIEMVSTRTRSLTIGNSSATIGTLSFNGTTVNGVSDVILRNASGSNLILQNNETGSGKTMNVALGNVTNNVISLDGAGNITISSVISGSGKKLTLSGTGTGALTLSGANTFSGGLTINAGTKLNINNAAALGTGAFTISGGTIDNSSAAAITNSNNNVQNWNGDFTFTGTKDLNLGTGAVTLGASRTITTTAGNFTVGGIIGDSGTGFGLTKTGAGTLVLSGANTYTGTTSISNGALKLGASNVIADVVNVAINAIAGATATFDLNDNNEALGFITFGGAAATSTSNLSTGAGTLTLGGDLTYDATNNPLGSTLSGTALALGASRTFNIGDSSTATSDLSVSASITGSGFSLTKSGAGTLALSGNNTYSGGTTVNAGTIAANSATALGTGITTINSGATVAVGAFTIGSNFTINFGGTLTGTGASSALGGIINGPGGTLAGTLAIASGGSVAPGSSPGLLNIAGAVTFNSGSRYTWELGAFSTTTAGTNFDQIVVANGGSLSLLAGATLVPTFTDTATSPSSGNGFWTAAQTWTVVTNTGGTVTGTAFAVDNASWSGKGIFAASLANNEVLLTWTPSAIPEPSTYAAIFGVVALGGALWRRRNLR